MKPVGYLLNKKEGVTGDTGLFYDYILAENGVFIRAQNPLLKATLCISPVEIRGLSPLSEEIELAHGKMPQALYDLAVSTFIVNSSLEQFLAVTWEDRYRLRIPTQSREAARVRYEHLPSTVLDIHSHGVMDAFFSGDDNEDEQGLGLYMVVGRLDTLIPEVKIRLGVYGNFAPVTAEEIFDE